MSQTLAIFTDAYRELNSKKMFWITMILSGIVVLAFAAVGINEKGITLFGAEFQSVFNTGIISRAMFYKMMFSSLAVAWWLNFFGIILALVSTGGMIPDFIAGGSVDLYLSKPISRMRLFLTKYASGLLFAALQVLVFSASCFFVIGLRAHAWEWRVFLAVPVVVLVFSYLYCVCALLGMLTRSTVASLLLTILFWFIIFGIDAAEQTVLMARIAGGMEEEGYRYRFAQIDQRLTTYQKRIAAGETQIESELTQERETRTKLEEKKRKTDPGRRNVATAHKVLHAVKAVLPKTGETNILLTRWLNVDESAITDARMERREKRRAENGWFSAFKDPTDVRLDDPQVVREFSATLTERPVRWVIGTSLAFEAVVLGLAGWIFCRRDY